MQTEQCPLSGMSVTCSTSGNLATCNGSGNYQTFFGALFGVSHTGNIGNRKLAVAATPNPGSDRKPRAAGISRRFVLEIKGVAFVFAPGVIRLALIDDCF